MEGIKRKVSLGPVARVKKYDAETKFAAILEPINARSSGPMPSFTFGQFVRQVYLPFYRRKWKGSTTASNEQRIKSHLSVVFEERALKSFAREELQVLLDRKAAAGASYSVVAHLRWDMRQIFNMAVVEDYLSRNPAELLFIPREARRPDVPVMTFDQVRLLFSVLDLRERLIAGLAAIAGMRPGEIFALRRARLERGHADIDQRVYRGEIDTPKTIPSKRWAALADGLFGGLRQWVDLLPIRRRRLGCFLGTAHDAARQGRLLASALPSPFEGGGA